MAKGDNSKLKCKKCGTIMTAISDPFMGVKFMGKGKKIHLMSQFVQCPKCKTDRKSVV